MYAETRPLLSNAQVADAGELLIRARRGEIMLGELPQSCRPQTFGDSQRIIDYAYEQWAVPAAGWKIYFPYKPRVSPVVTPIYEVLPSDSRFERENCARLIEAEVVFRARADLSPREAPYRFEEAVRSFAALPAFELLRTRYLGEPLRTEAFWPSVHPPRPYMFEMFADNTVNDGFVVGEECESWLDIDFTTLAVTVSQDDRELGSSTGGHPIQDPFLATFAGLNFLRHRTGVAEGQIIATTSVTDFFEVTPNSVVIGDFGHLGRVAATFMA